MSDEDTFKDSLPTLGEGAGMNRTDFYPHKQLEYHQRPPGPVFYSEMIHLGDIRIVGTSVVNVRTNRQYVWVRDMWHDIGAYEANWPVDTDESSPPRPESDACPASDSCDPE